MNKNKYSYFLDQCNKTPLSKEWRAIFGLITEKTVKRFRYKIINPDDFREALNFVEVLNKKLDEPIKYYDLAYKDLYNQKQIPEVISAVIGEILNDRNFQILLKKERSLLGIPIETGLELPDPKIHGEHKLTKGESEAIKRLSLYTALTGKSWSKFFTYLLVHNYVVPITYLEIRELAEVAEDKSLLKQINRLFSKLRAVSLKKRQTKLLTELLGINEEIAAKLIYRDGSTQDIKEKNRIMSRASKSVLRELLENIYPKNRQLAKTLEAIKKRRLRLNKKANRQLKELAKKSSLPPKKSSSK